MKLPFSLKCWCQISVSRKVQFEFFKTLFACTVWLALSVSTKSRVVSLISGEGVVFPKPTCKSRFSSIEGWFRQVSPTLLRNLALPHLERIWPGYTCTKYSQLLICGPKHVSSKPGQSTNDNSQHRHPLLYVGYRLLLLPWILETLANPIPPAPCKWLLCSLPVAVPVSHCYKC